MEINESVKSVLPEFGAGPRSSHEPILEASLSRVLQHIAGANPQRKDGAENSFKVRENPHFAILTSWRHFQPNKYQGDRRLLDQGNGDENSTNRRNFKSLVRSVNAGGLGAIRLTGGWLDDDSDPSNPGFERSIFIPGDKSGKGPKGIPDPDRKLTLKTIKRIGTKFNQDSIIYAGPETGGKVMLFGQDRDSGTWSKWAEWEHVGIEDINQIGRRLRLQKQRILKGDKTKFTQDEKSIGDHGVGSTQVGGRGKAEVTASGTKTDPGASRAAFMFEEVADQYTVEITESFGVTLVRGPELKFVGRVLESIDAFGDYDGPRPQAQGALHG